MFLQSKASDKCEEFVVVECNVLRSVQVVVEVVCIRCRKKLFERWTKRRKRCKQGNPKERREKEEKGEREKEKKRNLCTDQNDPWRTGNSSMVGSWEACAAAQRRAPSRRMLLMTVVKIGLRSGAPAKADRQSMRCEWLKQGWAPSASGGSEGANVWCDGNWGRFAERYCDSRGAAGRSTRIGEESCKVHPGVGTVWAEADGVVWGGAYAWCAPQFQRPQCGRKWIVRRQLMQTQGPIWPHQTQGKVSVEADWVALSRRWGRDRGLG